MVVQPYRHYHGRPPLVVLPWWTGGTPAAGATPQYVENGRGGGERLRHATGN